MMSSTSENANPRAIHRTPEQTAPYNRLFDAIPCYVSVQDRHFHILQANQAFKKSFGDRVGDFCYQAYKGLNKPCHQCNVARSFQDGEIHSGEEEVRSQDGKPIHMIVYSSPLKDDDGRIDAVMEMSIDVTEMRRLQEQLASLGALVSGISHSIKGIAMALDGSLYVVNSGFRSKKEDVIKKGWDMVERNVQRISNMVLDILYCSKERMPERASVSPAKIAHDACNLLESKAKEQGVALQRSIPEDQGDFTADKEKLHAVLVNLITNAIDACFNDPDKTDHFVKLSVEYAPDRILFHVADNGTGIGEDMQQTIFSAFQSTKGAKGTGLGLFLSQKAAREHSGSITLRSELGKGSTFTLHIPRQDPIRHPS
ncbi:MAG: PAS domain-containing sensor histidine kinase [Candidatus Omnitrophota bacterium]